MIDAEQLAILFHETYESLAPEFGYETRLETRVFDPYSSNGRLMIAVCQAIIGKLEADNARHENTIRNLSYEITELSDTIAALRERVAELELENTMLRKLVLHGDNVWKSNSTAFSGEGVA